MLIKAFNFLYISIKNKSVMTTKESNQLIEQLVNKLLTDYAPLKIILFGSQAAGKSDAESDIDLLIIKETNERFIDRWVTVRKILSDPLRRVAIETFVLTPNEIDDRIAKGDQFITEIMEKGRVLYAA
jgi:uncharacterized protein